MLRIRPSNEKAPLLAVWCHQVRKVRARTKAFQDRIDALKAIEAAYENQAGKAIAAEAKATELRTNANMEQKQREDVEREQRKIDARNKEIVKSKEFNAMYLLPNSINRSLIHLLTQLQVDREKSPETGGTTSSRH